MLQPREVGSPELSYHTSFIVEAPGDRKLGCHIRGMISWTRVTNRIKVPG